MKCNLFFSSPTAAATVSGLGNLVPVLGMGGLAAAAGAVWSLIGILWEVKNLLQVAP